MAKDFTDYSTHDFINAMPSVVCGQVLMNRQRHYAIVVKKSRAAVHLICVKSGMLKVTRLTLRQITEEWLDAEYPYDKAIVQLQDMARRHGATAAAKNMLEKLLKNGKEPSQVRLFD
jgi:hypothetical protein